MRSILIKSYLSIFFLTGIFKSFGQNDLLIGAIILTGIASLLWRRPPAIVSYFMIFLSCIFLVTAIFSIAHEMYFGVGGLIYLHLTVLGVTGFLGVVQFFGHFNQQTKK
jgi:hypothetical protein